MIILILDQKKYHAQAKHISDVLIKHGHDYDSSWITRPLREDETVESVLCSHSERLAIAYHFIQDRKTNIYSNHEESSCVW